MLEALVVHRIALDGERLDDPHGPFAELHRPLGIDLVAHRNDGGKLLVLGVVRFAMGASAFGTNAYTGSLSVVEIA